MTVVGPPVAIIGKFQKQPDETIDYDVDFSPWFSNREDEPALVDPVAAVAEDGITIVSATLTDNVVKVTLAGGTAGTKYKVTVLLTTLSGLVKEADFTVTVKSV